MPAKFRTEVLRSLLGCRPVSGKDWNWPTDVTLSHNKGTFKNIPTLDRTQIQAGQYENKVFKMIEGEKLGTFGGIPT